MMAGFTWGPRTKPIPRGLPGDLWCVRDAFCDLFHWPPGSAERDAFIELPEPEDVERLADHLGLEWFDPLFGPHVPELEKRLDHPGISWWLIHQEQMAHVVYEPNLRRMHVPARYAKYRPDLYRVIVDVRQEPHL